MRPFIILALLIANASWAARLEDVKVLDSTLSKDGLELKLQTKDGPKDSYFLVNVVRSDRDSFDKLALVIKKLKKGSGFKLTLDIPNFSAFPAGSYYRSEDISFTGSESAE